MTGKESESAKGPGSAPGKNGPGQQPSGGDGWRPAGEAEGTSGAAADAKAGGGGSAGSGPGGDAPARPDEQASAPEGGGGQAELQVLRAERDEWRERALRARADYDNLYKRTARDAQAERERQKARVLEALLPLWELARAAAQQAQGATGGLAEGIGMLAREFDRLMDSQGLQAVGAVGDKADPSRHEVLAAEPSEGVASGCVSRVVAPGYLLDGRVLRYAKVCVAP